MAFYHCSVFDSCPIILAKRRVRILATLTKNTGPHFSKFSKTTVRSLATLTKHGSAEAYGKGEIRILEFSIAALTVDLPVYMHPQRAKWGGVMKDGGVTVGYTEG